MENVYVTKNMVQRKTLDDQGGKNNAQSTKSCIQV